MGTMSEVKEAENVDSTLAESTENKDNSVTSLVADESQIVTAEADLYDNRGEEGVLEGAIIKSSDAPVSDSEDEDEDVSRTDIFDYVD